MSSGHANTKCVVITSRNQPGPRNAGSQMMIDRAEVGIGVTVLQVNSDSLVIVSRFRVLAE